MSSINFFKTTLIEAVETELAVPTQEHDLTTLNVKASFVLRHKVTGLPLGAFYMYAQAPTEWQPEWTHISKQMVFVQIYIVNFQRFIKTGELEMLPVYKNQPIPSFKALDEPVKKPVTFDLQLNKWEKNGFVRYYVNGKGYGAEKEKNLNAIWNGLPTGSEKVYIQDGKIKCFPRTPIKPEAEAYIQALYKDIMGEQ